MPPAVEEGRKLSSLVVAPKRGGPFLHASGIASYILIWRNNILSLLLTPSPLIRRLSGAMRVCSELVLGRHLVTPLASHLRPRPKSSGIGQSAYIIDMTCSEPLRVQFGKTTYHLIVYTVNSPFAGIHHGSRTSLETARYRVPPKL